MEYNLIQVVSDDDWKAYHAIRRAGLFEGQQYDENHPDDRLETNVPLLLKCDNHPVGTVRLDMREGNIAIVRLMAIKHEAQRHGHGQYMLMLIEEFARAEGVNKLLLNAAPEAEGFYMKLGFSPEVWDENELVGIAKNCMQMSKVIN